MCCESALSAQFDICEPRHNRLHRGQLFYAVVQLYSPWRYLTSWSALKSSRRFNGTGRRAVCLFIDVLLTLTSASCKSSLLSAVQTATALAKSCHASLGRPIGQASTIYHIHSRAASLITSGWAILNREPEDTISGIADVTLDERLGIRRGSIGITGPSLAAETQRARHISF